MANSKNKNTKHIRKDTPSIQPIRIGGSLPIRCSNHDRIIEVAEPDGWENLLGGCDQLCGGTLPCGHPCELVCHPISHEEVNCIKCRSKQRLLDRANGVDPTPGETAPLEPRPSTGSKTSVSKSSDSWTNFADHEPARVQKRIDLYQSSPEKTDPKLIDHGAESELTPTLQQMHFGLDGAADGPYRPASAESGRVHYVDIYQTGGKNGKKDEDGQNRKNGKDWSKENSLLD